MFRSLRANALFWLSLPLCLSLMLIPQVYNVMLETVQVPSLARNSWEQMFAGSPFLATGFLWFLAFLTTGTLAAAFTVVPPDFLATPPPPPARRWTCFGLLVFLLFPLAIRKEWPAAWLLLLIGLALTPIALHVTRPIPGRPGRRTVAALLLALGLLKLGVALYVSRGDAESRPGVLAWLFAPPTDDPVQAAREPRYDGDLLVWLYLALVAIYLFALARWLTDRMCAGMIRRAGDPPLHVRFRAGGFVFLVGVLLLAVFANLGPVSVLYPLSGCLVALLGGLTAGGGVWLLGARGPTHDAFGRLLGWLVVSVLVGELLWALASFPLSARWFSYRLYTIWAVLEVVVLIVAVASLLDTLERNTPYPARLLGLVGLGIAAWLTGAPGPERLPEGKHGHLANALNPDEWPERLLARIEQVPDKGPVVLVASAGGGSRAAIFAGLVLESLSRTPFGPEAKSTWGQHVVLISGVSGGSLGTARYVHALPFDAADARNKRDPLRHSVREELAVRMVSAASDFRAMLEGRTEQEKEEYGEAARNAQAFCEWFLRHVRDPKGDEKPPPHDYRWVVESAVMDDLCTDFMAPILRGALTPLTSRGATLREFWTTAFHWEHCHDRTGYSVSGEGATFDKAHHPLTVYNACDVRRGSRLAVGFPPLPAYFLRRAYPKPTDGDREGIRNRPGDKAPTTNPPEGLLDLDANRTVRLADAVGLSANFPFGFNPLTIERRRFDDKDDAKEKVPPEKRREELRNTDDLSAKVLDGGIVDNTGIDTLFLVLEAIHQEARAARERGEASSVYVRIRDELLARRVFLVEIDSGAKPDKPGVATRWLSVLFDPLAALNNSAYINAAREKRNYYTDLDERLSKGVDLSGTLAQLKGSVDTLPVDDPAVRRLLELEARGLPRFSYVPFDANHFQDENVLTAWSLGPSHKALLLVRFLIEQERAKKVLDDLVSLARTPLAREEQQVRTNADKAVDDLLKNPSWRLARLLEQLKRDREGFAKLQQEGRPGADELANLLRVFEQRLGKARGLVGAAPSGNEGAKEEIQELLGWARDVREELGKNAPADKVLATHKLPAGGKIDGAARAARAQGSKAIRKSLDLLEASSQTRKVQQTINAKSAEAQKLYNRAAPAK